MRLSALAALMIGSAIAMPVLGDQTPPPQAAPARRLAVERATLTGCLAASPDGGFVLQNARRATDDEASGTSPSPGTSATGDAPSGSVTGQTPTGSTATSTAAPTPAVGTPGATANP